jgi:hypothetical protein
MKQQGVSMKRSIALIAASALALCAQTPRPASSRQLQPFQWSLATLSSCATACYPQAGGANDTADMYLGNTLYGVNSNTGVVSAGFVTVGASATTVSFVDGNGVVWNQSAFPATASGSTTYPLYALLGAYFAGGLHLTCSGGCSGASAQVYYQR